MEAEPENKTVDVDATPNEVQNENENEINKNVTNDPTTSNETTDGSTISASTKAATPTEVDNDVQILKMNTDYLQVLQEQVEADEEEDITEAAFTEEVTALVAAADDDNYDGDDGEGPDETTTSIDVDTVVAVAAAPSNAIADMTNNDSNNIINEDQETNKQTLQEEIGRAEDEATNMVLEQNNDTTATNNTTSSTPVTQEAGQDEEEANKPSSQEIEKVMVEKKNAQDQIPNNDVSQDVSQNHFTAPITIATNATITTTSQFNPVVLEEDDDDDVLDVDDDDEDDDDEIENTVTYISVYTGEEIEKPSSSLTSSGSRSKKRKKPSTSSSSSRPSPSSSKKATSSLTLNQEIEDGFFALRKGRTTTHCIYLRKKELDVQIKDFSQAEYEHFTTVKKAVEYIQNDPIYVIRDNNKKKRKVYEFIHVDGIDGVYDSKTADNSPYNDDNDNENPSTTAKKAKATYNEKDDNEESWEGMYVQLLHFHREHGNTDVPLIKKHKSLSEWVKKQRKDFIALANGMDSTMTEAKVQLLLGLNFDFSAKTSNRTFHDYCQELVNYRARNEGDDPRSGTNLNSWILRMRKKYELYTKSNGTGNGSVQSVHGDRDGTVTPTRVHGMDASKCLALEIIGFSWTKEPSEESKKKGMKFTPVVQQVPVKLTDMGTSSYAVAASSTGATAMAYASATAASSIVSARCESMATVGKTIQKNNELLQKNDELRQYSDAQGLISIRPKGSEKETELELKHQRQGEQIQLQQTQIQLQKQQLQHLQYQLRQQNARMGSKSATATMQAIPIPNVGQPQHTPILPVAHVNNKVSVYTPVATKPKVTTTPASYKSVKESKWNKGYANLKKFKQQHKNLDVEGESELGKWCLAQRKLYKKHKSGVKTFLNEAKIGQLRDLGFDFEPMSFLTKHQRNFYSRLEELKKFKEENGHCEVPTKSNLYAYLLDQKAIYKKYEEEKKKEGFKRNNWIETKIAKLKELDFDFVNRRKSDARTSQNKKNKEMTDEEKAIAQEEWMKMFEEIKAYKARTGHCVPPSKPWTKLRSWMEKQRHGYKNFLSGKPTDMTGLRIRYLNEIQFPFAATRVKVPWDERFLELKRFKEKYGNCLVPRGYQGKLGGWVQNQRAKYKARKKGKESALTDEQIKKLDDLGMVWSILPTPVVHERKSWEERFQDLLKYKEEHGHMRVPQSYPGLGNWVHSQRVGYQLMKKGETSRLNTPKALKLAEVGFEFVVAPNKQRGSRQNLYNPIPHIARRAAEQAAATGNNNNDDDNDDDDEEESSEDDDNYEEEEDRAAAIQLQQTSYSSSWYTSSTGPTYM